MSLWPLLSFLGSKTWPLVHGQEILCLGSGGFGARMLAFPFPQLLPFRMEKGWWCPPPTEQMRRLSLLCQHLGPWSQLCVMNWWRG